MPNPIIQHLTDLRQAMKNQGIDLYIQPSSDPHLSEYVADRFKGREFLSGFTGSAGTLLITAAKAVLFTDGRYFIQAEKQLEASGIELMKMDMEGYPTMEEWVMDTAASGSTIGFDGRLYSQNAAKQLISSFELMAYDYITNLDLLETAWPQRPALPLTQVFHHPLAYTGKSTADKLADLRLELLSKKVNTYILCSLNDIAWLFNIRANDVAYTPVAYAYAMITATEARLYIHLKQLSPELLMVLEANGVEARPYDKYYEDLLLISGQTLLYDPAKVNGQMALSVAANNRCIEAVDPVYMAKACLSQSEQSNLKKAQIKDGAAMVSFLHWFDDHVPQGSVTELDAEKKVHDFRAMQEDFIEPSFKSIPAYGANAAMMHYSTSSDRSPLIEPKGLFLLDSGGQYMDGTTDITRTVAAGLLTDEEKRDFTLVLKAHIRLNLIPFLQGVTGTNLDIIARQVMWEHHMDYKSGTGHSIGYLLGVHEGPARIRMDYNDTVLQPGMVLTNEPGIYKEGKHGIRIENTVMVKEVASNETGTYLGFEVISYCPIDLRCVLVEMLDEKEKNWLNWYHAEVRRLIGPHLNDSDKEWLQNSTREI